jgi:hypothetical protein
MSKLDMPYKWIGGSEGHLGHSSPARRNSSLFCSFCVQEGCSVLYDSGVTRPGELICGFIKQIGLPIIWFIPQAFLEQ